MQGERERQLVLLLVTGIVVVVIVAVLLIIGVWSKKAELTAEQKEYKLGRINLEKNTNADLAELYVKGYFSEIEQMLLEEDYDRFYSYLGEDYIEYSGMTRESVEKYLIDKKIIGEMLELKAYECVNVEGYSNVYVLNIKLKDGVYDIGVVVREISPNNYTLSFEEYIKSETLNYNSTMNSVNLSIGKAVYFSNYVEYDVTVKNVHDDTIRLNTKNMPEDIYLKLTDGTLITPYNVLMGGSEVVLERDRIKEYKIRYNVENGNIPQIESFVIKDIYYDGKDIVGDAEFVF